MVNAHQGHRCATSSVLTADHYVLNQSRINYWNNVQLATNPTLYYAYIFKHIPSLENYYTGASADETKQVYSTFQHQDNSKSFT